MKKFIILFFILSGFFLLNSKKIYAVNCPSTSANGTFLISTSCSYPGTVDGADYGSGTTNTAIIEVAAGQTLTISASQTLATGSIKIDDGGGGSRGSITILGTPGVNHGQIKLKTPIWVDQPIDADGDTYYGTAGGGNAVISSTQPSGKIRKNLYQAPSTLDCNDSNPNAWRLRYRDADGDSYCASSSTTCVGNDTGYRDSCTAYSDCDDSNANIGRYLATGGTISYISGWIVHKFTSSGTFQLTCGGSVNAQVLVVGGGGGGGDDRIYGQSGGGGAGGCLYNSSYAVGSSAITVTVGAGGGKTVSGGNSVFGTLTAIGGGNGGGRSGQTYYAGSGGSGGGGSYCCANECIAGSGTSGQGYAGANGDSTHGSGGGGGCGAAGNVGGVGGAGAAFSITGTSTYYGGGGGASPSYAGGTGGGGAGGSNGTANTGGGGGGNASGGSGVVIVRYPL
jgi:hypothetical protein